MRNIKSLQYIFALFALILGFGLTSKTFAAATIVIANNDPAGVGFNDTTVVSPVGGNTGTTLGQQRLNAFNEAARIWGSTLDSNVIITVRAQWTALTCTATSAVLGSAGATTVHANFANAPFQNSWYGGALANKINGADLNVTTPEINTNFNVNLGKTDCLNGSPFYLGFDENEGTG
ncbi:MAG: peptidase, partial [Pyrinomonadaceae bacterium]|nr:peptidase [Pyrinomonadaceae bacterium]